MASAGSGLGGGSYNVRRGALPGPQGGPFFVAVTIIREDANNARQHLLERHAAALVLITHPHVETLLQTNYPGQPGFLLVTPWPDGGDLRAYLASNPEVDVLLIARTLARTVHDLHVMTPTIIHGNLDLSSVLMHNHTPRLWDFALCRLQPAPANGPLAVTPAADGSEGMLTAMAPELYRTDQVSTASDVYAFGILLFELFARHRPFPSTTRLHAAVLLCRGDRPSRIELPLGPRSDAVWAIIVRCWAQDVAARPTMAHVLADLHHVL